MSTRNYLPFIFVVWIGVFFLHSGAILKKEGKEAVIAKTQADPITYKAKKEEIKDGIKGAPTPSFEHYGHRKFLSELPVDQEEAQGRQDRDAYERYPKATDPIPEDLSGVEESSDDDWWFEEWNDDLGQNDQNGDEFNI